MWSCGICPLCDLVFPKNERVVPKDLKVTAVPSSMNTPLSETSQESHKGSAAGGQPSLHLCQVCCLCFEDVEPDFLSRVCRVPCYCNGFTNSMQLAAVAIPDSHTHAGPTFWRDDTAEKNLGDTSLPFCFLIVLVQKTVLYTADMGDKGRERDHSGSCAWYKN